MKFSERLAARRGRTRRSPRMSCSLMTAASAVSNPVSRPSTASAICGFGSASASGQDATLERLASPWSASTWPMRSRAPSLHSATATRLPSPCSACACLTTASNTLAFCSVRSAAKLRPVRAPTSITPCASGTANGVSRASADASSRAFHSLLGQIEPVRRQRLVDRAAAVADDLLAGLVVVRDLREPLAGRLFVERLQHNRRAGQIIEQRVHLVVEQRQPVLHAGMAAAFAHRFVQHVVALGGAERRDIAGAELADRLGGELEFGDRHEVEPAHVEHGALRLRIEAADRLQRVAEEIEPHRQVHARREQVEDAAAHRIVARLAHGRGADEAVELQPLHDARHAQHVAGRGGERLLANQILRRHALQHRIDGGEQHRRLVAPGDAREPRQRGHALRHDAGVRRYAVIGLAVPGGKLQHLEVGREECDRPRQRRHARAVAADHQRAGCGRVLSRRHRAGEIGDDQAFRTVRHVGKRQRPAGRQKFGWRIRHRFHLSIRWLKSRKRRNSGVS